MSQKVITRFPPSPTGFLHIGGVRTALFNYLFAAHEGGHMVLRFEDTDRERSKPEFEADILESLKWINIPYELADVPRQSERADIYKQYIPKLVSAGHAYEAEAGKENPSKLVVRFKNPNKAVTFLDAIRGEVTFDTTELGDFVIARSLDEPLYHLAVVIDDHEMQVTHVIRGEDHVSNTPRQILMLEALGFARPEYAHIPLILAPDKSKLSKRHGAVSATEYRTQGFVPEALINYLALLGWNPGGEQEIFTLDELVKLFTLDRVHKGGAVFDIEKLKWFNHEHLKRLSDEEYGERLREFSKIELDSRLIPLIKERAKTLLEAKDLISEYAFLKTWSGDEALITNFGTIQKEEARKHLLKLHTNLKILSETDFENQELIKKFVMPYANEYIDKGGRGMVLWPFRVALSGQKKSPDPFTIASLLGKDETLGRIEKAIEKL